MKVTKNLSFGQLYVSYGDSHVRIPKHLVEAFLEHCDVDQGTSQKLDQGEEITINLPFNLATYYQG